MTWPQLVRVAVAPFAVLLLGSFAVPRPAPAEPAALKSELRVSRHFAAGLEYLLVEPRDARPDEVLPMIVDLHGRGGRPAPPRGRYLDLDERVRLILPRAPEPAGDGYAWMPVSAHRGESPELLEAIDARVQSLSLALDRWRHRYPTRGRPIVTGFSQGGILAAVLALREPTAVSQAIPVSGWLPPTYAPARVDPFAPHAPIHALHGADDPVLDAGRTRAGLAELRAKGYPVVFEAIDGVGHELAPETVDRLRALMRRALRALPDDAESSGLS